MNKLYLFTTLFIVFVLHSNYLNALDLYWVGGSGNFNDNTKWRVGSINGSVSSQAPISSDNCYFMGSALNTGTPITVNFTSNASCKSLYVDSLLNSTSIVTFASSNSSINFDVYGSFHLGENSRFNFLGILRFRSFLSGTELIKLNGNELTLNYITFDGGLNTEWQLLDSFYVDDFQESPNNYSSQIPSGSIVIKNGSFNTNKQYVRADFIYSNNNSSTRSIIIDSSTIELFGRKNSGSLALNLDFNTSTSNFNVFSNVGSQIIFNQSANHKQGCDLGNGLSYNHIITNEFMNFYGNAQINRLVVNANSIFTDTDLSIDTIFMASGHEHYIHNTPYSTAVFEIDHFSTLSDCQKLVHLKGYDIYPGIIRKKNAGTLTFDRCIVELMTCDASGNRSYVVNNGLDRGENIGSWIFNNGVSKTMRFEESTNLDWHNPTNWKEWDGSNWVPSNGCLPDHLTDVVIDSNSFIPGGQKSILINNTATCKNLTWHNNTQINSTLQLNDNLNIYGNFSAGSVMDSVRGTSTIWLHGLSNTFNNSDVYIPNIITYKYSDYTFLSNIRTTNFYGYPNSTITCNNKVISCYELSLANVNMYSTRLNVINRYYECGGSNKNFSGNSTIFFTNTTGSSDLRNQNFYFNIIYPSVLPNVSSAGCKIDFRSYNTTLKGNIILNGDLDIRYQMVLDGSMNNESGKIIASPGNILNINTVSISDSLITKGNCNNLISIGPYNSIANISTANSDIESCFITSCNFSSLVNCVNSIDGGSNTNVNIVAGTGTTFYWRASYYDPSDFTGDWGDAEHWSTDSTAIVGVPGGCMPSLADNVVFDDKSFSGSSNGIIISSSAFCNSFTCKENLTVNGSGQLYISGDLNLETQMTALNFSGTVNFIGSGQKNINTRGNILKCSVVKFDDQNGSWTLLNDFELDHQTGNGLLFNAGNLILNGKTMTLSGRFASTSTTPRTLDMRNSQINVLCNRIYSSYWGFAWDLRNANNITFLSDSSLISFKNNTINFSTNKDFHMGTNIQYGDIEFLESDEMTILHGNVSMDYAFYDGTARLNGSFTFDSLRLKGGEYYYLRNNYTQNLAPEHGKIIAEGNSTDFVFIESTTSGSKAYINKEYGPSFCVDFVKVKDIEATKGLSDPVDPNRHQFLQFETGINSDNINGTATGIWAFTLPPGVQVIANHASDYSICNGGDSLHIPLGMTGTYPYIVIYEWNDELGNTGQDTIIINDDDNNIYTQRMLTIPYAPAANGTVHINPYALRCGVYNFAGPQTTVNINTGRGPLSDLESHKGCYLSNRDHFTNFYDQSTNKTMMSVKDKVGNYDNNELGNVRTAVYFDQVEQLYDGYPYLKRHWIVDAENTSPAQMKLYLDHQELVDLTLTYFGFGVISLQDDVYLLEFQDTIGVGIPDTIPFNVLDFNTNDSLPFTNTTDVMGIEFFTSDPGAYMLRIKQTSQLLPLNLTFLSATKEENKAHIEWRIETDTEIDHYVVERSYNGVVFEDLAQVKSKQSSEEQAYHIYDDQPFSPISYYRLKIIQKDGSVRFTDVVSVSFERSLQQIRIYPNPANEQAIISYFSQTNEDISYEVFDAHGQLIHQGIEYGSSQQHIVNINTIDWQAGLYMIRIFTSNGIGTTKKIVIRH